jgi:hypothetical protein
MHLSLEVLLTVGADEEVSNNFSGLGGAVTISS